MQIGSFCAYCQTQGSQLGSRKSPYSRGQEAIKKKKDFGEYYDAINRSESPDYYHLFSFAASKTGFQFIKVIVGHTLLTSDVILPAGSE